MIQYCKVCQRSPVNRVFQDLPADRGEWYRCLACGSDSNATTYREVAADYNKNFTAKRSEIEAEVPHLLEDQRSNLDWFVDHSANLLTKDFLDIGCREGAALKGMSERGWASHGFDVVDDAGFVCSDANVIVSPFYHRWLFNKLFSAIQVREVIEHIDGWRQLLTECYWSLHPRGLLQVQTPRPLAEPREHVYGRDHLLLFSPNALETKLKEHGFAIIDSRIWDIGQAWICRKH